MNDHILHWGRKHFCRYFLQALEQEKNLNVVLKIALKLMVNKLLRYLKRVNILNSNILEEK